MNVFDTQRLSVKIIAEKDRSLFVELLSDPRIIPSAPHRKVKMDDVLTKFKLSLNASSIPIKGQDNIWGVFIKGHADMIGLAAILTNDEQDWELGYRFLVKYWGKGYGSELAAGIVRYTFEELGFSKITADVDIINVASAKILGKIMLPVKEFYNDEDRSVDRRYEISKEQWLSKVRPDVQ
ncbi:MAG: GNAT family N-acetyltransferase [Saprospiraceae bacterium]|nr:GNAT family N-acetyltransferase [Saprospiraceae bacterium]